MVQYDKHSIFQVRIEQKIPSFSFSSTNSTNTLTIRFNPHMSTDIAMDEKNDLKLINMLWETKAYMHANRNKVIEMVNLLK